MRLSIELTDDEAKRFKDLAKRKGLSYANLILKYIPLTRIRLTDPEIQEIIQKRQDGMSYGRISEITGIKKSKIINVLKQAGVNITKATDTIRSADKAQMEKYKIFNMDNAK